MSIKGLDIFKSNRMSFMKLYNYKNFNDIPYESLEFRDDLIQIACNKNKNPDLIKYTKKKVFFLHPTHRRYGCDIFGSVFDLDQVDQPQKMIYKDTIYIMCKCQGIIKYDYLRFKYEALPIRVSDKMKQDYQSTLDDELNEEENEKYELEKQMKMMAKIRNSSKSSNNTDDESSDETDDESNNEINA